MEIKEFIKKGIEGGGLTGSGHSITEKKLKTNEKIDFGVIMAVALSPNVWRAVGKIEGWQNGFIKTYTVKAKTISRVTRNGTQMVYCPKHTITRRFKPRSPVWKKKMNGLMPHLQKGGTIESYIKTL